MSHPASRRVFRRDQSASNTASSSSTPFHISDTSPLFSYGPVGGSSSTSLWTAGYAKSSDGYDETLHLTTASNSKIAFNVTASSLSFLVPSYNGCQATVSINSSSPIPACPTSSSSSSDISPFTVYNLPLGIHNVQWNAGTIQNGEQVMFWGIDGTRPIERSGYQNATIDDSFKPKDNTNVGLKYEGDWTHLNPTTRSDALSESGRLDGDFNKTLAITQSKGSAVTFSGSGTAVYIYGTVGPDYGFASVSLNGQLVAPSLNLTSPWQMPYELLWFQTGLDTSQANQVVMTNLGNRKMALDFVVITTDQDTLSHLAIGGSESFMSSLKGKLIIGLAIPFSVVFFLALLAVYLCGRRHHVRQRRNRGESSATLRPSPSVGGSVNPIVEKGLARDNTTSNRSVESLDDADVFVSYDEALQQRMSERWRSPISPSNSNGTLRTPRTPETASIISAITSNHTGNSNMHGTGGAGAGMTGGLASVPEDMISSPERIRSLLGSQYSVTNPPDSRRGTALPAYTPEGTYVTQFSPPRGTSTTNGHSPTGAYETLTGTGLSNTNETEYPTEVLTNPPASTSSPTNLYNATTTATPTNRFPTAAEEKAAQLAIFKGFESSSTNPDLSLNLNSTPPRTQNTHSRSGSVTLGMADASLSPPRNINPDEDENPMHLNRISNTPSDILSIFGTAPGSEARLSTLTDWTATAANTPINSNFNFRSGSRAGYRPDSGLGHYPLPPLPIDKLTQPLNLHSTRSNSSNNNNAGNNIPLPSLSTSNKQPIRPKVDMTFLNQDRLASTSHSRPNNNKSSISKHPFLISPAPIPYTNPYSSTSRSNNNLPPSSYINTPITPHAQAINEEEDGSGRPQKQHHRNQSTASAWTVGSAARPDSAIIPFENFFSGLQNSSTPTRQEGQ
ncbi:uncharacterized protein L201_006100 [Kwoniella dendrophila CBS 6074]|uniref:Peptidase A1 domain-containing protein n=1 Tax=Kwoniella dendrophila CBS 6074 TaxID=1295534 RepID=A0AAX4K1V4_9TREE